MTGAGAMSNRAAARAIASGDVSEPVALPATCSCCGELRVSGSDTCPYCREAPALPAGHCLRCNTVATQRSPCAQCGCRHLIPSVPQEVLA